MEPILPAEADPRRWAALIVLLAAAFMNLLDVSIVNIAVPSIQRGLHASYAQVQWTLAGVAGFTIMSALCGAAQGPATLIGSRVAQGAMGALMIPQVLSVIQVSFGQARFRHRDRADPLVSGRRVPPCLPADARPA